MQGMRKTPRIWKSGGGHTVYLVTFYATGGNCDIPFLYTGVDGKLTDLPVASRDGYDFLGWYTAESGGTKVDANTVFAADAIVYAQWEEHPTVTITVTSSGNRSSNCYIRLPDGTKITAGTSGTYEVDAGSAIYCYAKNSGECAVYVNGASKAYQYNGAVSYSYTANGNISVALYYAESSGVASIRITES